MPMGAQGKHPVRIAHGKSGETQGKHRLAQRGSEVHPERGMRSGIGRGKKKNQHKQEARPTCGAHEDAEDKPKTDGQLAVGDEESKGGRVWQDKIPEHGNHEGVGAVRQEAGDVALKPAAEGELGAEDFVLGKDEEEDPYSDPKEGERECVPIAHRGPRIVRGRLSTREKQLSLGRISMQDRAEQTSNDDLPGRRRDTGGRPRPIPDR